MELEGNWRIRGRKKGPYGDQHRRGRIGMAHVGPKMGAIDRGRARAAAHALGNRGGRSWKFINAVGVLPQAVESYVRISIQIPSQMVVDDKSRRNDKLGLPTLVCRYKVGVALGYRRSMRAPPHVSEPEEVARLIGKAIRQKRELLGFSQEDFAELSDQHRTYVGAIERGERNPTLHTLVQIAAAFGQTPSQLLKEAGL